MKNKNAAIDLGYGWTKAAVDGGKAIKMPSVIGEPGDIYEQDIMKTDIRYYDKNNVINYFVGDLALRQSDIKYVSTGKDKSKAFHTKILLESCLGQIANDGDRLNIVTGLPMDFYNTQKKDMEKLLSSHNATDVYYISEGRRAPAKCRAYIDNFKIVPQHMGAFMHHILDDKGNERIPGEILKTWLVIDPGRGTLGLMGMEKGKVMKDSCSPPLGVEVAYKIIQDELKKQLGRTPDRFLLDTYVLDGEYDGIDLMELRDYAFDKWATQIQLEIDSWNRNFYGYIIAGGWADVVAQRLSFADDAAVIVMDQWANLNGYLKIAKRTWRENT